MPEDVGHQHSRLTPRVTVTCYSCGQGCKEVTCPGVAWEHMGPLCSPQGRIHVRLVSFAPAFFIAHYLLASSNVEAKSFKIVVVLALSRLIASRCLARGWCDGAHLQEPCVGPSSLPQLCFCTLLTIPEMIAHTGLMRSTPTTHTTVCPHQVSSPLESKSN